MSLEEAEVSIETVAQWLAGASKGVAFTGAGVSTESGIPDFRGPGGFWERNDASKFTIQNWIADPEHRRRQWQASASGSARSDDRPPPEPNPAHHAIARLEQLGLLRGVITQNVDGLHHEAGSRNVLELHGTTRRIGCLSCDESWPSDAILARVHAGDHDPHCELCGGILKRATISFGQQLRPEVVDEAHRWSVQAEVCLVVGSSLVVYPAAAMPEQTKASGGRLVIVNREPTPLDPIADAVIHADAGPTMTEILERVEALTGS